MMGHRNEIVPVIIPNLTIEMEVGEMETRSDGRKYRKVNFISNRLVRDFSRT